MKNVSSASIFYVIAAIIVVGLVAFSVVKESAPSPYDTFAQCLTEKGVKMYGAWWCPHCQNQKELFGTAFSKLNYTECSAPNTQSMNQLCKDAGITGYPTWEFSNAERVSGEQTFQALAEKSGCELPAS
jgi:hypothetical protein